MSLYGRLFAAIYDASLTRSEERGLREARRATLAAARGRVLEVGAGTGANADLYPPAVEQVVLCEPDEAMARRLERNHPDRTVVRAPAERLPFGDGEFDAVVSTLVLCTVDDVDAALREIARVLKPGGALLFLEHVRDDAHPDVAKWQDRVRPLWQAIGRGCRCNRRTVPAIEAAGFAVEAVDKARVAVPRWVRPVVSGRAAAPART